MEEPKKIDQVFALEVANLQEKYSENIMLLGELENTKHNIEKEINNVYGSLEGVNNSIDKVMKNIRNKYGDVIIDLNNMVYTKPE